MRTNSVHPAIVLAALAAAAILPPPAVADVVSLKTGGTIQGKVAHSAAGEVAVRTAAGSLIVVERSTVTQVQKGTQAAPQPAARKSQFSAEESAWFPKVRQMVARLRSDDTNRRSAARSALQKIDDPNAIPALRKYLSFDPSEDLRGLFVSILKYIPGDEPVVPLVEQSLADPSPGVRDAAIEAIGEKRAPSARPHYVKALQSGYAVLVQRAAVALKKLGDPKYTSVAALIDNLSYQFNLRVMTSPGWDGDNLTIEPTPKDHVPINDSYFGSNGYKRWYQKPTANQYVPPPGGLSPGNTDQPAPAAPLSLIHRLSNSTPPTYKDRVATEYRPDVYDALRSITGKDFKLDHQAWRDWLKIEQKNREIKEKATDRAPR